MSERTDLPNVSEEKDDPAAQLIGQVVTTAMFGSMAYGIFVWPNLPDGLGLRWGITIGFLVWAYPDFVDRLILGQATMA